MAKYIRPEVKGSAWNDKPSSDRPGLLAHMCDKRVFVRYVAARRRPDASAKDEYAEW